jgi:hypothetical protein
MNSTHYCCHRRCDNDDDDDDDDESFGMDCDSCSFSPAGCSMLCVCFVTFALVLLFTWNLVFNAELFLARSLITEIYRKR